TNDDKSEEVRFSTRLPDNPDVKITKIYRLAPKDYHVTLQLKFDYEKNGEKQPPLELRYQVTGAQGLPIEGEWYATTFRNAYMAIVDPANERAYRDVEESLRISQRRGGDTTPR